jgi:pimeloyl-ACP methyl ester carboxylesterase
VAAWRQAGTFQEIAGHSIFVHERVGSGGRSPVLFLHGYPSSSYDWRDAFDRLDGHRLFAFDFLGFGLSDKPREHLYSLRGQADLVEALAQRFGDEPVVMVSHDMGSSVATEILARDIDGLLSFKLRSALLFNASLVRERARAPDLLQPRASHPAAVRALARGAARLAGPARAGVGGARPDLHRGGVAGGPRAAAPRRADPPAGSRPLPADRGLRGRVLGHRAPRSRRARLGF